MSADLLRRAATILRERAAEATAPGEDVWCPSYLASSIRNMQRNCDWECPEHEPFKGPDRLDECNQPSRHAGNYIATMHPGVGLALADWLDDVARLSDQNILWRSALTHGLAVARLIVGEQ